MKPQRLSDKDYDRFAEDIKDEIYRKMDSVKALMACFIVDDKVSFGKKTGYSLEGIRNLIEKEIIL